MNKKYVLGGVGMLVVSMMIAGNLAYAQTATTTATTTDTAAVTLQAQIQALMAQIEQLKAQVIELQKGNAGLQGDMQQMKQALRLNGQLRPGMHGEEVKRLQEVLATDPNIFSKENITGFYGPMTRKAIENFQKHFGFEVVGAVGPKTLEKINELLSKHDATEGDLSEGDLGDLGDKEDVMNGGEHGDGNATSTMMRGEHERGNATSTMMSTDGREGEHGDRNSSSTMSHEGN